jgi:hypothetical protein
MKSNNILLILLLAFSSFITSCDKTQPYDTILPPSLVHFIGDEIELYRMVDDSTKLTIEFGTTDVSSTARTYKFNFISSTAVQGVDYTTSLSSNNTLQLPAGATRGSFKLDGVYENYPEGVYDTLLIAVSSDDVATAPFLDTIKVILYTCNDLNLTQQKILNMLGTYSSTIDYIDDEFEAGPYSVTIGRFKPLDPTTAEVTISGLFESQSWGGIKFIMNWSDTLNPTCTVVQNDAVPDSDAFEFITSSRISGPLGVRPYISGIVNFCDQALTLNMELGATLDGSFSWLGQYGYYYKAELKR